MQKLDKMNQLLDQFSVTLNKKHFDAALAIKDEIKAAGFEDPAFKVKTVAVYKIIYLPTNCQQRLCCRAIRGPWNR